VTVACNKAGSRYTCNTFFLKYKTQEQKNKSMEFSDRVDCVAVLLLKVSLASVVFDSDNHF